MTKSLSTARPPSVPTQPMYTVVLALSLLPFLGAKLKWMVAFNRLAWCFFRNAASAFDNVNLTVSVLAPVDLAEALLKPLAVATNLPAPGTLTSIVAVFPFTLWPTTVIAGLHPLTPIGVSSLIWAPSEEVNSIGIFSLLVHRLPFAANSENGPDGTDTSTVSNGASGTVLKVALVTPVLLMKVSPWTISWTPSPWRSRTASGNFWLPYETKYKGPESVVGRISVWTTAWPITDAAG